MSAAIILSKFRGKNASNSADGKLVQCNCGNNQQVLGKNRTQYSSSKFNKKKYRRHWTFSVVIFQQRICVSVFSQSETQKHSVSTNTRILSLFLSSEEHMYINHQHIQTSFSLLGSTRTHVQSKFMRKQLIKH